MIPLALFWLLIFVLTIINVEGSTLPNVAMGWLAGYHLDSAEGFTLSNVSWSEYTHLSFAFAETTPSVHVLSLNGSGPDNLPLFVEEAHKNNLRALITCGGWTGSNYFSSNVGSAENRTAFVKTVIDLVTKYKVDGIDFDWEYPTSLGDGCNIKNENDTANFLLFLQELRDHPTGRELIISAATTIVTFTGSDGKPLEDVSGFAKVLDFIEIMNYDVFGPWGSNFGPNSPVNDACADTQDQIGSAASAVQNWNRAGMPMANILMGVPSYGHSVVVETADAFEPGSKTTLAFYPNFNASANPMGDSWDNSTDDYVCGILQAPGGTINYWGMFELGYLNSNGTVNKGILYRYDNCSQTPYVYNPRSQIMVSYDNPQSFAAKGKFILENKLRGFAMWEVGGDYKNALLSSIRAAAEYS